MRVLIVEDEPAVRDAVERALRSGGHKADLAKEGPAGLEMALANPNITAIAVEATEFPDLSRRYRVNGVPKTVVVLKKERSPSVVHRLASRGAA